MGLNVDEESKMLWIWSNFLVVKWVLMDFNSDMIWIWIYLFVRRFISFQDIRIFWRDSRRGNVFDDISVLLESTKRNFLEEHIDNEIESGRLALKSQQIFYSDSKSDSDSLLDKKKIHKHTKSRRWRCYWRSKILQRLLDNVLPPN